MVQLKRPPEFNLSWSGENLVPAVRLEIAEPFDDDDDAEEDEPLHKRCKTSPFPLNQGCLDSSEFQLSPSKYDPLKEPSPLGLRLRKSPSLLELIQMRISQGNTACIGASLSGDPKIVNKKDFRVIALSSCDSLKRDPNYGRKKNIRVTAPSIDKLKASNFPASLLRIGGWKYESRNEGDIIAKCYFSKHKLVWELLGNGLKKKIEIQWSDIIALKAKCPGSGPGTLTVVLGRQPLFFTETNPQPRRHILWQATADFTGGQASTHRMHCLQCPEGVLNKHYEKLIQCDSRLNLLSQQPDTDVHSLYFVAQSPDFKDPGKSRDLGFNRLETAKGSPISILQDISSESPSLSSSSVTSTLGMTPEDFSKDARSPSSGNGDSEAYSFHGPRNWEQSKVPGIQSSELSDLASHVRHGISEQRTYDNQPLLEKTTQSPCNELREIAEILLGDTQMTTVDSDEKSVMKKVNSLCCLLQHHPVTSPKDRQIDGNKSHLNILFSDAQLTEASDEKSVMSRVNSLCCLLQDPGAATNNIQVDREKGHFEEHHNVIRDVGPNISFDSISMPEYMAPGSIMAQAGDRNPENASSCNSAPTMSRKDSLADLLFSLPRVASLPKFLFEISEDGQVV